MAVCAARACVVMVSSSFPTAETICSLMVAARALLFPSAVRHHSKWTPIALTMMEASTRLVMARRIPIRICFFGSAFYRRAPLMGFQHSRTRHVPDLLELRARIADHLGNRAEAAKIGLYLLHLGLARIRCHIDQKTDFWER